MWFQIAGNRYQVIGSNLFLIISLYFEVKFYYKFKNKNMNYAWSKFISGLKFKKIYKYKSYVSSLLINYDFYYYCFLI